MRTERRARRFARLERVAIEAPIAHRETISAAARHCGHFFSTSLGFRAGTVRPGPAGPRIDHLLLKREFLATAGPCELESRECVAAVPLRCA
jgi:hypothetical protein